jgi:hypothetical protein
MDVNRLATIKIGAVLLAVTLATSACGGGSSGGSANSSGGAPPGSTYSAASGVAQKGPLIKGSTVNAQQLDARLSPTGQQFSYQITSDLGTFSPTSIFTSQYIGLNASGYYFDEVQNTVSTGQITLIGYSDLAVDSVLNVNLLTTLAYQRIHALITTGMTFSAARTEAENEVLTALNIPIGSYGSFGSLDLSGSTDGDHILAAISSIFIYGNSAGPLSELIANFQSDIGANGVITNSTTKAELLAASQKLNPTVVAANLTARYASQGVTFTTSDISDWIAQSGDRVVGKFAFQVPDATPSSVFTFPSFVANQFAGTSVSVTAGQMSIDGTPINGAVSINAGDVMTVSPGASAFPNGILTSYLVAGSTNLAKVSFVSGLLSISVTPSAPNVPIGLTQQFKATGTFSDTSTADLTNSVSWTSGTPALATVNATTGLATSVAEGSTAITATSGSVSGSATLNVTPAIVESIAITPNPAVTGIGKTRQLAATGRFSDGTTATVTNMATWSSGSPAVATVGAATGLTAGVSQGSSTISATIGSITASTSLSVVANAWVPTGSLSTGRVYPTATLLSNGTVLAAGGVGVANADQAWATAELYNPIAGVWSPAGSMASPRTEDTATLLANGAVLVVGGTGFTAAAGTAYNTAELYNPVAGTWSSGGSMSAARLRHTATLLGNGEVLVTGGGPGGITNGPSAISSAEIYDPVAGTWAPTASMSIPREMHTATLLPSGKILVAGPDASAEIYDPASGTWTVTTSMSTSRVSASATLLPNGKVLVVGGASVNTAEIYDPVAATWTLTGSMSAARQGQSATLLPNGTVLVAGGGPLSAEIYDPAAGTWSLAGSLLSANTVGMTSTLLSDGTVLAVGGLPAFGVTTSWVGAEIYY